MKPAATEAQHEADTFASIQAVERMAELWPGGTIRSVTNSAGQDWASAIFSLFLQK